MLDSQELIQGANFSHALAVQHVALSYSLSRGNDLSETGTSTVFLRVAEVDQSDLFRGRKNWRYSTRVPSKGITCVRISLVFQFSKLLIHNND